MRKHTFPENSIFLAGRRLLTHSGETKLRTTVRDKDRPGGFLQL